MIISPGSEVLPKAMWAGAMCEHAMPMAAVITLSLFMAICWRVQSLTLGTAESAGCCRLPLILSSSLRSWRFSWLGRGYKGACMVRKRSHSVSSGSQEQRVEKEAERSSLTPSTGVGPETIWCL